MIDPKNRVSPRELARAISAIDHDTRQPQHAAEMALRRVELLLGQIDVLSKDGVMQSHQPLLRDLGCQVSTLRTAVRQVIRVQRDLVDAMSMEFAEIEPKPSTIQAHDVISRALRANRALDSAVLLRGVQSRLTFVSDERLVERILNNLVVNAILHSGATLVSLGARQRSGSILFELRDNGRGLPLDVVSDVFNPNLKRDTACGTRTGLGLYNVQRFAERLGGEVRCRSQPGKGTLFQVVLPGPVGRVDRPRQPSEARGGSTPRFVAALEYDARARREIEDFFESRGDTVYSDHDPLRWLSVVTDLGRPPDIVLFGVKPMGERDLFQLDVVLRRWSDGSTRVVVLTDLSHPKEAELQSRGVETLRRPVTARKLEAVLP